jgi:predicted O-methyltransferase YrrM
MITPSAALALDSRVTTVLAELHDQSRRELPSLISYFLFRSVPQWLRGRRMTEIDQNAQSFLSDKLIALARDKCEFCYLVCRSLAARRIVEVGTSFGVSTIYLSAAARDNANSNGGDAVVVGTEIDSRKIAMARRNLERAGLSEFADIRIGDARQTLNDVAGPIDFVLLDSWIGLARPIIEMLAPRLRPGAVVVCDNTAQFSKQYRDYLDFVRNPQNGFRSIQLPFRGGMEFTVRGP